MEMKKIIATFDTAQMDGYIEYIRSHGIKANSVYTREGQLRKVLQTLQDNGFPTDVRQITDESIYFLQTNLGVKETTARMYISALSQFIKYHTGSDRVKELHLMWNRPQYNRAFITRDELDILCRNTDVSTRLFFILGAYMGLRCSEILDIRFSDIHHSHITIHGKGHGTGLVINQLMPQYVYSCIKEYIQSFRSNYDMETDTRLLLFFDRHGKILPHKGDKRRIGERIRSLGRRLNITVTAHSLRRLYACTLFYDIHVDLVTLQRLMRHSDVKTTISSYIQANPVQMRDAVDCLEKVLAPIQEYA